MISGQWSVKSAREEMKMIAKIVLILITIHCSLTASCALRKAATAITADILNRGMVEIESEGDLFVAKETALPLLKILEVLHHGDPKNRKFLGLLAKAYGNYAFGFAEIEAMRCHPRGSGDLVHSWDSRLCGNDVQDNWSSRAKRFYIKGRDYGIAALSHGKQSIADIPLNKFSKYLHKFGKKDTEALFWTAFNWGSYINMSRDDITAAADLPRVQAIVDRVIEIQPDFQCGTAYAFKGALLAGNPLITGGKPKVAKPYFEKALQSCNGAYLMNKVMYAQWYLKAINDKAAFKKILEEVTVVDVSALPDMRLANEVAKERAALLLLRSAE